MWDAENTLITRGTSNGGVRDQALDGIRGLAIFLVFFHHIVTFSTDQYRFGFEKVIAKIGGEGWIGVDLFFVLSGFLITRILLASKSRPGYFRNFYIRRTLRIFPLYYLFLVLFFIVLPALPNMPAALEREVPSQLWYWLYVPNVRLFLEGAWLSPFTNHTWSLAIEEQFYLFWPCLVYLWDERRLPAGIIGLFLLGLAVRSWLVFHGYSVTSVRVATPAHWDGLMLGALLAVFYRRGVEPGRWRKMALSGLAVGVALRLCLVIVPQTAGMEAVKRIFIPSIWSLIFAALLANVISSPETGALQKFFRARPLVFLGIYSYGLYLFHQPIFYAFDLFLMTYAPSAALSWLLFVLIPLPLSMAVAWLLFHFYETPFLKLKERFTA